MSEVELEVVRGVSESKMFRYRKGDIVTYVKAEGKHVTGDDGKVWIPMTLEGTVKSFANEEGTYLNIDFGEDEGIKTLTEDEVIRVG